VKEPCGEGVRWGGGQGRVREGSCAAARRGRPRLVEEAGEPGAVGRDGAGEHVARVVRSLGRQEADRPVNRVGGGRGEGRVRRRLWHVREPAQHLLDAVLVVDGELVGDAVWQHDLRAAELVLRRVNLLAEQLVERAEAGEQQRPVLHLDDALGEPVDVGACSRLGSV